MAPSITSSMLGWVAAVIETELPSQPSPAGDPEDMNFVNPGLVLAHSARLGLHSAPVLTALCFGCCHVDLLIILCAGATPGSLLVFGHV